MIAGTTFTLCHANGSASYQPTMYYRLNEPDVIEETIDGEAVIVNLATGSYYSADKLGACLWACLSKGFSKDAAIQAISEKLETADVDAFQQKADQFIADLLNESVIVTAESAPETTDSIQVIIDELWQDGIQSESLVLNKYSDMQELLMLDPIHDVDKMGWPQRAPE